MPAERVFFFSAFVCGCLVLGGPAVAWGDLGHEVTAIIAYRHLSTAARTQVDALLAADGDTLTAADFASRANWADVYRNTHRETSAWHYVDLEIDGPDLDSACYGFPRLDADQVASAGPAQDCIVNKLVEFAAELGDPSTAAAERQTAMKFLIHLIGDLHQPLHASDHHDRGGNCVKLEPSPDGYDVNLHAYWDIGVVNALGRSAPELARTLDARITAADLKAWNRGNIRAWAMESFALARKDVYKFSPRPTCGELGTVRLTPTYERAAETDAGRQLAKAGVRMAVLLNRALGNH